MKQRRSTEELEFTYLLTPLTWYVVEVSFRKSNPIHRAICEYRHSGNVDLIASYEGIKNIHIDDLSFFKVVGAIDGMNCKNYPNKGKLPDDEGIEY